MATYYSKIGMPVVINLVALEIGEFSYNAVIHTKDADEITSSVDTDQTIRGRPVLSGKTYQSQ